MNDEPEDPNVLSSDDPIMVGILKDNAFADEIYKEWRASRKKGSRTNFREAKLDHATLEGAQYPGSMFLGAELNSANLRNANLEGAIFTFCSLQWAKFVDANLRGTDFRESYAVGANFENADLEGVKFSNAKISTAIFSGANLQKSDFQNAILYEANLKNADIRFADFRMCDLQSTDMAFSNLSDTDLKGADLRDAYLHGANLRSARNLTQEQLDSALGDASTLIPNHLIRPAHWLGPIDDARSQSVFGPEFSLEFGGSPPDIPRSPAAPIRTKTSENRVVLDLDAEPETDTDREDLHIHWEVLKQDADRLTPRLDNVPGMARRVEDYIEALGENFEQLNEILLGLRGEALSKIVAQAENEILGQDALGELQGLAANHQIFMRHFPKWLRHIAPAEGAHITTEAIDNTKSALHDVLSSLSEAEDIVDPAIPEILKSLEEVASDQKTFDRWTWLGVHRGVNDVLNSLAKFSMEFVRRTANETLSRGSKRAADLIVSGLGSGLLVLIGLLPIEYAWIGPVLTFLRRVTGEDDEGADSK